MAGKRTCSECEGTGFSANGFCHMCSGQGYTETLSNSTDSPGSGIYPNRGLTIECMDMKQMILSISAFTTSEQLSDIMSHYMNNHREH